MDTCGGDDVAQRPARFRQPPLKRSQAKPGRAGDNGRAVASRRCTELFGEQSRHMGIASKSTASSHADGASGEGVKPPQEILQMWVWAAGKSGSPSADASSKFNAAPCAPCHLRRPKIKPATALS